MMDCRCKDDKSGLEQVGEKEHEEGFQGKWQETRTHYVCKECGQKWLYTDESGLSRGRFWNRED